MNCCAEEFFAWTPRRASHAFFFWGGGGVSGIGYGDSRLLFTPVPSIVSASQGPKAKCDNAVNKTAQVEKRKTAVPLLAGPRLNVVCTGLMRTPEAPAFMSKVIE